MSAVTLIKQFEGYSPTPYRCPAGVWTIGWGHVLRPQECADWHSGASPAQAEAWLEADIHHVTRAIARLITRPLTPPQQEALTSFTFNLGAGALQRSTLRRCINRGEHARVPQELMRWVWAGGRKLPGLVRRRAAEALRYQGSEVIVPT